MVSSASMQHASPLLIGNEVFCNDRSGIGCSMGHNNSKIPRDNLTPRSNEICISFSSASRAPAAPGDIPADRAVSLRALADLLVWLRPSSASPFRCRTQNAKHVGQTEQSARPDTDRLWTEQRITDDKRAQKPSWPMNSNPTAIQAARAATRFLGQHYLGPTLPGANTTWGQLYLGPTLLGASTPWGQRYLGQHCLGQAYIQLNCDLQARELTTFQDGDTIGSCSSCFST